MRINKTVQNIRVAVLSGCLWSRVPLYIQHHKYYIESAKNCEKMDWAAGGGV